MAAVLLAGKSIHDASFDSNSKVADGGVVDPPPASLGEAELELHGWIERDISLEVRS